MEKDERGDFPPKKAQSETPVKKLARQLDFTGFGAASAAVVLPEHPQEPAAQPLLRRMVKQMQPPLPQPQPQAQQQQLLLMPSQSQSPLPLIRPVF